MNSHEPPRKRRSDAVLLHLLPSQQAQLNDWLLPGLSYRQAQARLQHQFALRFSLPAVKPC